MVTSELDTEKNKNRLIVNNAQNNIILGDNNLQSNDFHSEETNHFNQSENKPSYYYYYEDCHQKRNDTGDDCKWFYKTYEASKLMDSSKAEEYQHPDCNHFLPITSISTIQTSSSGLTINGIKSSTNISSSIPSSSIGNTIINHKLYDLNICNPNIKMRRKYTRKRRTTSIKNKTYKTSRKV
ncbi:unnamed protein product [Heterobilharzia americana]|nr:unnamed protein product [Heterobilharzia americana]